MPLASPSASGAPPRLEEALAWSTEWPARFAEYLLQTQQLQLQALVSWQESAAAFQRELWDLWACRWAGGAPIDA